MTPSHAMSPLTDEQILASIAPMFAEQFRELKQTLIQPGEIICVAAGCSCRGLGTSTSFGFALVTMYRLLVVTFCDSRDFLPPYGHRPHIRYKPEGYKSEYYWIMPSAVALTANELKYKHIDEIPLRSIAAVNRKDRDLQSTNDVTLTELGFRDPSGHVLNSSTFYDCLVFERSAGQEIYALLQTVIRDGGKLAPDWSNAVDSVSQLERLIALHRSGALTDQEFRAAKTKLLGL